jgi:hypothetical protein
LEVAKTKLALLFLQRNSVKRFLTSGLFHESSYLGPAYPISANGNFLKICDDVWNSKWTTGSKIANNGNGGNTGGHTPFPIFTSITGVNLLGESNNLHVKLQTYF